MHDRDISAIFAGHDAGHYQLPPEALTARSAVAALAAARARAAGARAEALDTFRRAEFDTGRELVAMAMAGKPLPDDLGARVIAAKEAQERTAVAARVAVGAANQSQGALSSILKAAGPAIVRGSLRPALAEVVVAVRSSAPALRGVDLANPEAIMADKAATAAYQDLMAAAQRYGAIRACQSGLYRLRALGRLPMTAQLKSWDGGPPKAATPAAQLLELVTKGAELWIAADAAEERAATRRRLDLRPVEVPSADGQGRSLVGRRSILAPMDELAAVGEADE